MLLDNGTKYLYRKVGLFQCKSSKSHVVALSLNEIKKKLQKNPPKTYKDKKIYDYFRCKEKYPIT